jgi:hypothetical protein
MSDAILFSVASALLLGGASGFRSWWQQSLLISVFAIPFIASIVAVARLDGVFSLRWVLLSFFWTFLSAAIVWGIAAGAHHAAFRLYCRLTSASIGTGKKPPVL